MGGMFFVTKYCLFGGKYDFRKCGSPEPHSHVGHLYTSISPACTNSSGVITPFSTNLLSFKTGVVYSLTTPTWRVTKLVKFCVNEDICFPRALCGSTVSLRW